VGRKSVSEHLSKVNTRETKETTKKRTKFTFEGLSNKKVGPFFFLSLGLIK
jgi:hypothetical protein